MRNVKVENKIVEVLNNYFQYKKECDITSCRSAAWGKDVRVVGATQYCEHEISVKDINSRGMGYVDGIPYSGQHILPKNCKFWFINGEGITEVGKEVYAQTEGSGEWTYLVATCGNYLYLVGCSFSTPVDWWVEMKSYVKWEG
jgi:hypothetical protein